jgi:hypothetical protein
MECEFLVYCKCRPETTENAAKIARAKLPGQSNNFNRSPLGIAQLVANFCGMSSSGSEDGGADVIPVLFNTSLLMQQGSFGRFNRDNFRGRGSERRWRRFVGESPECQMSLAFQASYLIADVP